MAYEFKVTLNKIFSNTPSFSLSDEEKNALKTYSKDTYYPIINRLSRNTTYFANFMHRLGTYIDIRSTSKKEGKVASAQYIPFYIYTEAVAIAEKTLPVLRALFQQNSIKFPIRISLYRSIDNAYKKYFINPIITHYEDKAFTSTSISLDFVLGFKLETGFKTKLYLLPNIKYSLIPLTEGLTIHEHEKEILLNTGCVYFYIGESNYIRNLNAVIETVPIYEFILLPDIKTYDKIGHKHLKLMGEGIHEDYMNILNSIDLYETNTRIKMKDVSKTTYIAELEYLLQQSSVDFKEEALKLQTTLFQRTDPSSLEMFENSERITTKQQRDAFILENYMNTGKDLQELRNKIEDEFGKLLDSMKGGSKHLNTSNRFQFFNNYLRSQ